MQETNPPVPPPPSAGSDRPSVQKPADYYSSPPEVPPSEKKSGCSWWPVGCGLAGCLVLIAMLIGAAILLSKGGGSLVTFVVEKLEKDIGEVMTSDVTAEQKQELREQMRELRSRIAQRKVDLMSIQPLLEQLRTSIRDERLTPEEVDQIIRSLKELNQPDPGAEPAGSPPSGI